MYSSHKNIRVLFAETNINAIFVVRECRDYTTPNYILYVIKIWAYPCSASISYSRDVLAKHKGVRPLFIHIYLIKFLTNHARTCQRFAEDAKSVYGKRKTYETGYLSSNIFANSKELRIFVVRENCNCAEHKYTYYATTKRCSRLTSTLRSCGSLAKNRGQRLFLSINKLIFDRQCERTSKVSAQSTVKLLHYLVDNIPVANIFFVDSKNFLIFVSANVAKRNIILYIQTRITAEFLLQYHTCCDIARLPKHKGTPLSFYIPILLNFCLTQWQTWTKVVSGIIVRILHLIKKNPNSFISHISSRQDFVESFAKLETLRIFVARTDTNGIKKVYTKRLIKRCPLSTFGFAVGVCSQNLTGQRLFWCYKFKLLTDKCEQKLKVPTRIIVSSLHSLVGNISVANLPILSYSRVLKLYKLWTQKKSLPYFGNSPDLWPYLSPG